jgi:hypothetical protein
MPQCLRNKKPLYVHVCKFILDEAKLYCFPSMTFSTDLENSCVAAQKRAAVEGLYCKRPILCLASSELLTPPPHRPASVYPPAFGAGEETLAGWRGGVGQ